MPAKLVNDVSSPIPAIVIEKSHFDDFLSKLPETERTWVEANGFSAKLGQTCVIADQAGGLSKALIGFGTPQDRKRGRFHVAAAAAKLPEGDYALSGDINNLEEEALGWLMSHYSFDRYKSQTATKARLCQPEGINAEKLEAIATSSALAQDLINTPASDMGPNDLEAAFQALAQEFAADVSVISGDALLKQNFPMIHAVGRASDQAPRLLDLSWGDQSAPKVSLVGKGVCFDTGGLNIKPGNSMGLMKKDMGGAANTMALARMIMALKLPVRLRLLVPAVENSISAGAFRPGDILTSRSGQTVEINNTDAEGRLVLADALTFADEENPRHLVCMATLTGAARVALGPDLPPFYTDSDPFAETLAKSGVSVADPIWRMPFWDPYETMIEPGIADLDNAPSGGFAGSITAALFLRRFVKNAEHFVHFDIYGWTPAAKPARPKGGACQAARAVFDTLETIYGNA